MKLNKFLTALTPIAIIGTIAPIISSCGSKEYVIKYGDNINCRDKKEDGYQKPDVVKKQIKLRTQKEKAGKFDANTVNKNIEAHDKQTYENIYFDLVASWLLISNSNIRLTEWSGEYGTSDNFNIKFNLNDGKGLQEHNGIQYAYVENQMYITDASKTSICRSYIYYDCYPAQER